MRVLYFAWVRQKVGMAEEVFDTLPPDVRDIGTLVAFLVARSPGHAAAFANPRQVRAAVNQEFATSDTAVKPGDEVAFFPPVTGG